MKTIVVILGLALLSGCAGHSVQHTKHVRTQFDFDSTKTMTLGTVETEQLFFGQLPKQEAADNYGMAYVGGSGAAGIAAFLAGIATHAAVESSKQNQEKARRQKLADEILSPISGTIEGISVEGLMLALQESNSLEHPIEIGGETENGYVLKMQPAFIVSKDYSILQLKNIFALKASSKAEQVIYTNLVESSVRLNEHYESPEFAVELNNATSVLLKSTVNLAMSDIKGHFDQKSKMATFKIGHLEDPRYERGVLIVDTCEGLVFRNLRKWLIHVPQSLNHGSHLECMGTATTPTPLTAPTTTTSPTTTAQL